MQHDLSHWIQRQADFMPGKAAIQFNDQTLSYAALATRIEATAVHLAVDLGVGRGDRLAFWGYNHPDFLVLLFACARLGAMLVPLNWRLAVPEIAYILGHAEVATVVVAEDFRRAAMGLREECPECRFVALDFHGVTWRSFDPQTRQGETVPTQGQPQDPLLLVYTSGTTGRPKGAMLSQQGLFWNIVQSTHMHDLSSRDRVLTVLPMFHVGGLNIQTLPALHAGATVVLQSRFDPAATLAAIQQQRITLVVLVPATLRALIEHPHWADTELGSLRMVTTGSSLVPHGLMRAFHDRHVPVVQVYGTTETAPIAVYLRAEDAIWKLGSAGKPGLHTDIRLVGDDDHPITHPGAPGEVLVRGPQLMQGYWNDPEASREALRGGWFRTGDIGHWDEDGYLYIDDRKKDVIISGGENIYPAELELVLHELPGVAEASVVGRPDQRWGEVAVAVVVLKPNATLDAKTVLAAFQGRLARYKHPQEVVFVEQLPRNAMGKVQKFRLNQALSGEG